MNRGGLGLVDSRERMTVPLELLESFSISPGGVLFGIYYPSDSGPGARESASIRDDFIISPAPDRLWNRCARFLIRLRHRPDALQQVAQFLSANGVAILHSEGTRSGHRYGTWSLHVVFETADPGRFNPRKSYYEGTNQARVRLQKALANSCRDVLFSDPNDVDLARPVESWPHTALAYFHAQTRLRARGPSAEAWRYKPFWLRCDSNGALVAGDGLFSDILHRLPSAARVDDAPVVVYTSMDTRYLTIRAGIIPPEKIHRFFEISVQHHRAGEPDSCLGVIATLLSALKSEYNIWRIYNYTKRHDPTGATGDIVFLAEDISTRQYRDGTPDPPPPHIQLPKTIQAANGAIVDISEPSITPVSIATVRNRLNEQMLQRKAHHYDVFISFADEDRMYAQQVADALRRGGLNPYIAPERIGSGETFADDIREAISAARETCVVCTAESIKNVWVASEWGAAWGLGRTVVPITVGIPWSDLPHQLQRVHGRIFADLNAYVADVQERRSRAVFRHTLL